MGAGQSTNSPSQGLPPLALHVLRVTPSSPASRTSIEPFFDFIVGYEGIGNLGPSGGSLTAASLEAIVESHEGKVLNLLVWNSKNQIIRPVPITPSRNWSQNSLTDNERPSLLGLSMRMCEPEASLDNVWHVMDVLEGSPAESAGLVPYGDYIVGWSGGALNAENDFYELVESHIEKPLRVYVYSHDFDTLREVVLVPNRHWGGDGLLGCVFGFGLLHRIPDHAQAGKSLSEDLDIQEPGDETFYIPADDENQSYFPNGGINDNREEWQHPSLDSIAEGASNGSSRAGTEIGSPREPSVDASSVHNSPRPNGSRPSMSFSRNNSGLRSTSISSSSLSGLQHHQHDTTYNGRSRDEDGSVADTETTTSGGSLTSVD